MDPNALLTELRALLARTDLDLLDYERIAELARALDGWISHGGFVPDDWHEALGLDPYCRNFTDGYEPDPYITNQD